jgi:tRNA(fMet)-specific endonuclease VapC
LSGYLLDATALVEVLRQAPSWRFLRKLGSVPTADRWTTSMVVGELMHAARRAAEPAIMTDVLRLVTSIRVAPFDVASARTYGKLAASLEWANTPLAVGDLITVSVAKTLDMTLVTRRPYLFQRIQQLKIEDWTVDG